MSLSREIVFKYPPKIRRLASNVVESKDLGQRWDRLLELAEGAVAHLATLAVAQYRAQRWDDPIPAAEERIALHSSKSAMGSYVHLARDLVAYTIDPFVDLRARPASMLASLRLRAADLGIEEAMARGRSTARNSARVEVGDLRTAVEARVAQVGAGSGRMRVFEAFDLLTQTRNSNAHALGRDYPTWHHDFHVLMTPLLEEAVSELLMSEAVATAFHRGVVGQLRSIELWNGQGFRHHLDVDDWGIPLEVEVDEDVPLTVRFPAAGPWPAGLGCDVLVERASAARWSLVGPFRPLVGVVRLGEATPSPPGCLPAIDWWSDHRPRPEFPPPRLVPGWTEVHMALHDQSGLAAVVVTDVGPRVVGPDDVAPPPSTSLDDAVLSAVGDLLAVRRGDVVELMKIGPGGRIQAAAAISGWPVASTLLAVGSSGDFALALGRNDDGTQLIRLPLRRDAVAQAGATIAAPARSAALLPQGWVLVTDGGDLEASDDFARLLSALPSDGWHSFEVVPEPDGAIVAGVRAVPLGTEVVVGSLFGSDHRVRKYAADERGPVHLSRGRDAGSGAWVLAVVSGRTSAWLLDDLLGKRPRTPVG